MSFILQIWRQVQRTSSSLRYVNCGPGHIQCNYSSVYSGFSIQLNVSALPLEICRQVSVQWALHCTRGAKYSAQPVVPDIYNVNTVSHILASIFNWTYLRCYMRYIDNSMCVILKTWCQIQRTSSRLRYVNCGPGHIQCNYCYVYSGFNIQVNVSALLLGISRPFNERYAANSMPNRAHSHQFCAMWTVVPKIYNAITVPHIQASILKWTYLLCYWRYLVIQCALYCNLGAK
jgi:hypothetical protein